MRYKISIDKEKYDICSHHRRSLTRLLLGRAYAHMTLRYSINNSHDIALFHLIRSNIISFDSNDKIQIKTMFDLSTMTKPNKPKILMKSTNDNDDIGIRAWE